MIINKPMYDSIPYTGYGNFPSFVVANDEFSVTPVAITTIIQILKKFIKIFFEVILKIVHFKTSAFSFSECKPAFPNIFYT